MTLIELPDLIQGTDEWLDQRRGMVTASVVGQLVSSRTLTGIDYACPECAALPGSPCLSKLRRAGEWGTPIKTLHPYRVEAARLLIKPPVLEVAKNDYSRALTAQLVAERITGWTDPPFVSDDMLRGHEDEPRARDLYSEHFAPVVESGFMVRTEETWKLGYSPDGLVDDDGLIEVKSRRPKKHLQTILSGEVPPENMAQLQAGLLVSGREWIDYISYCGGMPLWVKRVLPDERWFDALEAAVITFEENAAEMVTAYETATAGMPTTERVIEMEMVI